MKPMLAAFLTLAGCAFNPVHYDEPYEDRPVLEVIVGRKGYQPKGRTILVHPWSRMIEFTDRHTGKQIQANQPYSILYDR